MLLLTPVLLALLLALLRGGSPRNLATLPIRGSGFIIASFVLQVALSASPLRHAPLVLQWNGAIYCVVIGLALLGALRNWHLGLFARLAILGVALNILVIAANGGHMPVNAAAMQAVQGQGKVHDIGAARSFNNTRLAGASSRLVALSDVIPIHIAGDYGNVYSVGDLMLAAGLSMLAYRATRRPWPPADRQG